MSNELQLKPSQYENLAREPFWEFYKLIFISMNKDSDKFHKKGYLDAEFDIGFEDSFRDIEQKLALNYLSYEEKLEFKKKHELLRKLKHTKQYDPNNPLSPAEFIRLVERYGWKFPDELVERVVQVEELNSAQGDIFEKPMRPDSKRNIQTILYLALIYIAKNTAKSNQKTEIEAPNISAVGKKLFSEMSDDLKKNRPITAKTISDYFTKARNAVLNPKAVLHSKS